MTTEIKSHNNEIYAILARILDLKDGSEWFGEPAESLQAQRMNYPNGKTFKAHRHILNPRIIKRTQEAFIVISGRIAVDVYDNKAKFMGTLEAGPGDAIFVYRGGHGVRVLEDFVGYEVKAGCFSLVSEDKEFINDQGI
jgi:mannose-6-phosphate isomerase-like protein (cupin superfamily)